MDPYLEEPSGWGGFHSRFINSASDYIADAVSPNFLVNIEERVYIVPLDDPERRGPIVPDVYIVTQPGTRGGSRVSEAAITEPTLIEPIYDLEIRYRFIEIRDTRNREVVTTIEVLSPFNKAAGTEGREAFLRKRRTVMASKTHWIEIDLLRAGERPEEVTGKSDYYALLKRGDAPPPYEAWLFDLRDTLPTIAVPLRPPFEDVPLNLQSIFNTVYTRGHYAEALDYSGNPPLPRLRPADAAWANGLLTLTPPLSPE
jgi:hypothetical protein